MTATAESPPTWLQSISAQLEARDAREKEPFARVSVCYAAVLSENVHLSAQVTDLQQALVKLKQEQWKASTRFDDSLTGDSGAVAASASAQSEVIDKLRSELMDLYRLRNEDAEALRRVKKDCEESEQLAIEKGHLLDEVSKEMQKMRQEMQHLHFENDKLRSSLTVMNAENAALRQAHDAATDELGKVKAENTSLTQRILDAKREQMRMHSEMQEEFERFKAVQLSHSIEEAATTSLMSAASTPTVVIGSKDDRRVMDRKRKAKGKRTRAKTEASPPSPTGFKKMLSGIFGSSAATSSPSPPRKRSLGFPKSPTLFPETFEETTRVVPGSFLSVTPPQLLSHSWFAHGDSVSCVRFDPSGKQLLSVSGDKTVKLWQAATGTEICRFSGARSSLLCCSFNPSGAFIAAGGSASAVNLWSVRTQKQVRVLNGHGNAVTCLQFSANTKSLVSGSLDRTLRVWDTERGHCKETFNAKSSVHNLHWSFTQRMVATAHMDGCIRFWGLRGKEPVHVLSEHKPAKANGVVFEPLDAFHVLTSSVDGRIIVWDIRSMKRLLEMGDSDFRNPSLGGNPVYSPDGRYIYGGSQVAVRESVYPIRVWDASNGKPKVTLEEHKSPVCTVAWSDKGGAASADTRGTVMVWV